MDTHQDEFYAGSIKAANKQREKVFNRLRKREDRLIVAVFICVCVCAEILFILALAHR